MKSTVGTDRAGGRSKRFCRPRRSRGSVTLANQFHGSWPGNKTMINKIRTDLEKLQQDLDRIIQDIMTDGGNA